MGCWLVGWLDLSILIDYTLVMWLIFTATELAAEARAHYFLAYVVSKQPEISCFTEQPEFLWSPVLTLKGNSKKRKKNEVNYSSAPFQWR